MAIQTGTKLGPYEILAPAGAGGMGEVYRARDTRLGRDVAVKVLPPHLSSSPDLRQRFEREARAISSLQHPHICTLFDVGRDEASGIDFIVLEYLEGETLAKRIEAGPLPISELMTIGIQIADALDKAHRNGIVHRDLKPANIMLTKTGAKLMDFGLAKPSPLVTGASAGGITPSSPTSPLLSPTSPVNSLTSQGSIVGTFQYMSPEQVEGREADARSDVFAFGAVLYEMATGKRAFAGKSQLSVASAILEKDPEPITARADIPQALEHVVTRCLAKDPTDRLQTAREVCLELQWVEAAGEVPSASAAAAPVRASKRYIFWMAAVLVAIAAAVAGWFLHVAPEAEPVFSALAVPDGTVVYAMDMAFSPDGRKLAFVARDESSSKIMVRTLSTGATVALDSTQNASFPFWSPDGRFIAFFAEAKLKRVPSAGGPPQTLCAAPDARGGTWGPNDVIIFTPTTTDGLYRVSAQGGTPVRITELSTDKPESTHRWPQFLPDGRFLYLGRSNANTETLKSGIYITSLDKPGRTFLVETGARAAYANGHLFFVRDGTLYIQPFNLAKTKLEGEARPIAPEIVTDNRWASAFAVSGDKLVFKSGKANESQLKWYNRDGTAAGTVDVNGAGVFRLSPDGNKLVVSLLQGNAFDIWIYDIIRKTRTRLTFDPGEEDDPQWSADGRTVFYDAVATGVNDLYARASDGSGKPELIYKSPDVKYSTSVSRDGQFLVFDNDRPTSQTKIDVYVLPLKGDRKPTPFAAGPFTEEFGEFSPDGRWIAYSSNESGRFDVYVSPFPEGGAKYQVSSDGGTFARWRADSRELYYVSTDLHLVAVDVRAVGRAFQAGTPVKLFAVRPSRPAYSYDVTPDGKRFLVNQLIEDRGGMISLVTNWAAGTQ